MALATSPVAHARNVRLIGESLQVEPSSQITDEEGNTLLSPLPVVARFSSG